MNDYFINVASRLDREIPPLISDPLNNMPVNMPNSFYMFPVTTNEVFNLINGLKNSRYGEFLIPTFVLKRINSAVSNSLADLINRSFLDRLQRTLFDSHS